MEVCISTQFSCSRQLTAKTQMSSPRSSCAYGAAGGVSIASIVSAVRAASAVRAVVVYAVRAVVAVPARCRRRQS